MNPDLVSFARYEAAVRRYAGDATSPDLLVASEGSLSCYYAPIDWLNPSARVVLVGITPGLTQARNALLMGRRELERGADLPAALASAKREGAFSGAMRNKLVSMLDHIGLNQWLGIGSAAELFGSAAAMLQSASILPYPVYVNSANYNGSPDPVRTPFLRRLIVSYFVPFLDASRSAIVIPLGPVPTNALEWLGTEGKLDKERVLVGLPHPSPANAERIAYFLGAKSRDALSAKTEPTRLDAARVRLLESVRSLPPI